jgi:hypothetical protein
VDRVTASSLATPARDLDAADREIGFLDGSGPRT